MLKHTHKYDLLFPFFSKVAILNKSKQQARQCPSAAVMGVDKTDDVCEAWCLKMDLIQFCSAAQKQSVSNKCLKLNQDTASSPRW